MGKDFDFKKLCAEVRGRDLATNFQNPAKKKKSEVSQTSSAGASIAKSTSTLVGESSEDQVISSQDPSNQTPQVEPTPSPSRQAPQSILRLCRHLILNFGFY